MKTIKVWLVLALVISTEIHFGSSVQPHREYLRWLFQRFRQVFWNQGNRIRQFAVLTVEQLNTFPNPDPSTLPLNSPDDWNAAYYADTIPEHTEPVLFERLRQQILDHLQNTNNLPSNIYLFTYNIPCPFCTQTIVHFVENVIPDTIRQFVRQHPRYRGALGQIARMNFRIGWNTARGNPDFTQATVEDFRDTTDDGDVPNIFFYAGLTLNDGVCNANFNGRSKRQSSSGYLTAEWMRFSGSLKQISAGDSGVWGVNKKDEIFHKANSYGVSEAKGDGWIRVSGGLRQIDVGYNTVWGVNKHNDVYRRTGISQSNPTGQNWQRISGQKFWHISVSQKGHVWGVNTAGKPVWRQGNNWKVISGGLKQISVGFAGVWGVNKGNNIYYRQGTFGDRDGPGSKWTRVSGSLKYVTSGGGLVWGVSTKNQVFARRGISNKRPTGLYWIRVGGGLKQIEVSLRSVWGVNKKDQIYGRLATFSFHLKDNSKTWDRISGRAKHVSTGNSGLWAVNKANQVYYRYATYHANSDSKGSGDWREVGGRLTQLDVGHRVVWGVNGKNQIYIRLGISADRPWGSSWRRVAGQLKHVSVSAWGSVWGVNKNDEIFHRVGARNSNPEGNSWKKISGGLKQISVGRAGVWGVNKKDEIFYRVGTAQASFSDGSGWKKVEGRLKYVSSGGGVVWGVNKNDQIYYREGISKGNPTGTRWRSVPGRLTQVETYDGDDGVWGVNKKQEIYGHAC